MRRLPAIVFAAGGFAIAALAVASFFEFAPRVVWNGSASAPEGLYVIRHTRPAVGDFVLVSPPEPARSFIAERGYLPPGTPLVKRVAARSGARICREETRISIDGIVVARALLADSGGRPMPEWSGCFVLKPGEIFLLNDHSKSLDGRYFGAVSSQSVIGVARPLWTFVRGGERDGV